MSDPASAERHVDPRVTSERYLRLVDEGVLGPDDRVELLEGVIVAVAPQGPRHAAVVNKVAEVLFAAVGSRGAVRVQVALRLGAYRVPEPDVAVVPGRQLDYTTAHPTTALLVVEVAETSLAQDRLSKVRIYAAAGVPEFWIVNLRDSCVEVFRAPVADEPRYADAFVAGRERTLEIVALPGVHVAVANLLPST
jgi:Uma2 family endonuclease